MRGLRCVLRLKPSEILSPRPRGPPVAEINAGLMDGVKEFLRLIILRALGSHCRGADFTGLAFKLGIFTAILLVDYTNQAREEGKSIKEALVEAGSLRLRPILMTTLSTILGMLPIALGIGAGAELRQSMGVVLVGGLITSTMLTFIVVPLVYLVIAEWRKN